MYPMFKAKHKYITFNALYKKDTEVHCDLYRKVSACEQPLEQRMVSRLIQNLKEKKKKKTQLHMVLVLLKNNKINFFKNMAVSKY